MLLMVLVVPKPAKAFPLPENELVSDDSSTQCKFGCQPDFFCEDGMCVPGPEVETDADGWFMCDWDSELPRWCSPGQSCLWGDCVASKMESNFL
ncbi:hypothetical protein GCK72_026068 [Caenorhabditis remanei]|uniref:Uncharacterized protein n=1 Tax=Caenorhabditis remanei TaxID=31234 RepID=A0A6A5G3V5_CAERE|nr:hypothetical protein GCK72_026068 [Caenorhabditis remanei]KAF1749600.1 hypothetical protein GCK72_026068 [Caenorhabditis remanei]